MKFNYYAISDNVAMEHCPENIDYSVVINSTECKISEDIWKIGEKEIMPNEVSEIGYVQIKMSKGDIAFFIFVLIVGLIMLIVKDFDFIVFLAFVIGVIGIIFSVFIRTYYMISATSKTGKRMFSLFTAKDTAVFDFCMACKQSMLIDRLKR